MEQERAHLPQAAGRSPQVEVLASAVVRLWAAPKALTEIKERNPTGRKALRIAAVRPDQHLSSDEYEMLEDSGVLVVEIPADFPSESNDDVARYLTQQLEAGAEATASRMDALTTNESTGDATDLGDFGYR